MAGGGADERDFSLVLGGPTYQALRRVRMTDDQLGLLPRRILLVVLVAWVPVIMLAVVTGDLFRPALSLLKDIGFHLRFLAVAPLLIAAEIVVHRRLHPVVAQFRVRALVPPGDMARFDDAMRRAMRLRNSVVAELALVGVVYAVGVVFTLQRYEAMGGNAWYVEAGGGRVSAAGLWLVLVSLPLLQFLLLRWYFRLLIWALFLWRVARIDLDLNATHPDKAGGLGFLSESLVALVPIAMAHGLLFSGMMADRIFFAGAELTDFQMEVFSGAVLLVVIFAGPLMVFTPRMAQVRRDGLRAYGALGQTYARDFREKWMAGKAPADEPLVGSGDIQSLADFGNSFAVAEQMRFVPIRLPGLLIFVAAFLAPIAPLALTMVSAETLLKRLVGVLF